MSDYSARLGTKQAALGYLRLGESGYTGSLVTTPTTGTAIGTFQATAAVTSNTFKIVIQNTSVAALVFKTYSTSVAANALVRKTSTVTTPISTNIQARFIATTPTTARTLAHQGPLAVKNSIAIFPATPVIYQGKVPQPSSILIDSITLLPSLYNTDPEQQVALSIKSAVLSPPVQATSPLIANYNPTVSPIVSSLPNINANLGAGRYELVYTYRTEYGESTPSPISVVNLDQSHGEAIQIGSLVIPGPITEVRYYLRSPQSTVFTLVASRNDGQPFVLTDFGQSITARIEGTLFELVSLDGELPVFSCDLRDFTLASLAYQIELSGYMTSVTPGWGDFAATILLDQFLGPAPSISVEGFTSTLWRIIRPLALCFEQWGDDLGEAVRQLDVRYASGRWLDWWGVLYGVVRVRYENDTQYRRRITWEVMGPRANGTAMEVLLKEALGYDSSVTDATGHLTTWYSNRNPIGAPVRNPATGEALSASSDTQPPFAGETASWDATATYNTSTYTWTTGDTSVLTWGLTNPTAATRVNNLPDVTPTYRMWNDVPPLLDPQTATVTWPGQTGRFKVNVRQVVENNQLGVGEISQLINRYKAAGYLFTLSVLTHYSELFDVVNIVKEVTTEYWQEIASSPAGGYYATMTMASLTMQWPPMPARERTCYEEWRIAGAAYIPWGDTRNLRITPDADHLIPLGLGGTDNKVPLAAPGIVPLG